jgi:hypothetical protein
MVEAPRPATAISDHDRTRLGSLANPPAGLQVQFRDGDRLHVDIVTHRLQPKDQSHASGSQLCDHSPQHGTTIEVTETEKVRARERMLPQVPRRRD